MMSSIWIPNSILNWHAQPQWKHICEDEWERAYIIWEHARSLVDSGSSEFILADGVANLKRALNHRLKLIEEIYSFKEIEISNKPKGYLELLERYDLVRPYLMKVLLNIRNDIEHNDAAPPEIERCKELVDVVWYFLKSTDSITQERTDNAVFTLLDENSFETEYWYSIDVDFENAAKKLPIHGWFPNTLIHQSVQVESIEVLLETIDTKKEKWGDAEEHKARLDTDICISGKLLPSPHTRLALIKKILTSY